MRLSYLPHAMQQRPAVATLSALGILLTAAATWLWAHAGHDPLPTRGVQVDLAKGQIILSAQSRDALGVQTAEVGPRAIDTSIFAYATLVAPWDRHAYVSARLSGRIDKLHVQPGQMVAAGQLLAEVQSLDLKTLQLESVNAHNDLRLSKRLVDQMEMAGPSESRRLLEEARSRQQQDLEAQRIARSKWLSLGLSSTEFDKLMQERGLQRTPLLPIPSPVGGVVVHADLSLGKVVAATEHLFEILDPSVVWVKIGVLEQDLHRIESDQPIKLRLTAYPDEEFVSKVWVKEPSLDADTHLGVVWAKMTNPAGSEPRLLPGMSGLARVIVSGAPEKLAVPSDALLTEGAERYVLIETTASAAGSQYQKQNVVVGRRTTDFVEILAGNIYPGDRVMTRGSHELAGFFVSGVLKLSPEAAKSIHLRVAPASRHVVEEVIELDGIVDVPPDRKAEVSAQLPGVLQLINVTPGKPVRTGEVLAEIASLELLNLQLDLLRADLDAGLRKDVVKRLRASGAALREIQQAESRYQTSLNRRESLLQKLKAIGLTNGQVERLLQDKKLVETLPLRAPIDGAVIQFNKVLGQSIKAEETLFTVHDLAHVWVQGYLFERDVGRIHTGQKVRVRLVADSQFLAEGVVVRSGRRFGVEDRTLSVWIELKDIPKQPLPYNLLARSTITVGRPRPVLAVPLESLVSDGLRSYLFVRRPDDTFERRLVETGQSDDRFCEISSGLDAGERIAVRGATELQTAYASLR